MSHNPKPAAETDRFFLSEKYGDTYLVFSMSSDEELLLPPEIGQAIRKSTVGSATLVDIGSADGRITAGYTTAFRDAYLFEPNPVLFSLLQRRLGNSAHCINDLFSPRKLPPSLKADVVVATHMLYHLEPSSAAEFLKGVSTVIKPGGLLIVTLWNEKSQAWKLCSQHSPERWLWTAEMLASEMMRKVFLDEGFQLEDSTTIEPVVRTYTPEAQEAVLSFLLGKTGRPNPHQSGTVRTGNAIFNLRHGLGNSQTIMVFRRDLD